MSKQEVFARIHSCVSFLASRCDYASTEDGQGFNGGDAEFGHSISNNGIFTLKQARASHKMIQKYRKQLNRGGLEIPVIDWEEFEENEKKIVASAGPVDVKSFDFESLQWTPEKQVNTKLGPRLVKSAFLTKEISNSFWNFYNTDKAGFKAAGYSIGKEGNDWKIAKWTVIETKPEEVFVEKITNYKIKNPKGLLKFQVPAVENHCKSLTNYGVAVDCSGTGIGKTYISLGVARDLNLSAAVVTVKPTLKQWDEACVHMGVKPLFVLNWEAVKNGKSGYGKFESFKNSFGEDDEKFVWNLPSNVLLIIDEIHKAKGNDTDNSKLVIAAAEQKILTLGMSATLADNPLQMKSTGFLLGLHKNGKDFWNWVYRHGAEKNGYGTIFDKYKEENKEHLLEIHKSIFPKKGSRIRAEDLGSDFPETSITADEISFNGETDKINKIYTELENDIKKLKGKENSTSVVIAKITRARQQIELIKTKVLVEMTENLLEEGNSVTLFVNYDETIDVLSNKLETKCIVSGNPKWVKNRQANIDNFQADKERVIICNTKAGGVGISLHDLHGNFPRFSLISPTYSAQDLKQVLGRPQRAGGKTKSFQKIIFAAGTVEEEACVAVRKKLENIATLNDGDLAAETFKG